MKKIIPFIGTALMVFIILGFSSQSGESSEGISHFLSNRIFETLNQVETDNTYDVATINLVIRKLAHYTEYLLFALFLLTALSNLGKRFWLPVFLTAAASIALAATDEYRQAFSGGRTSSLFDVGVDSLGALVGIGTIVAFRWMSVKVSRSR